MTAARKGALRRGLTAFAREVAMPDREDIEPAIDPHACAFRLVADRSPIHRWGLYAAEAIPSRRRVIQYTGELIGPDEIRRRSVRHHLYLFWCGNGRAIDGAIGGSGAEFINHCCEPNLRVTLRGGRVFYVSRRRIQAGEELTVDYNIMGDVADATCRCGARNCRGSMHRPAAVE